MPKHPTGLPNLVRYYYYIILFVVVEYTRIQMDRDFCRK